MIEYMYSLELRRYILCLMSDWVGSRLISVYHTVSNIKILFCVQIKIRYVLKLSNITILIIFMRQKVQ